MKTKKIEPDSLIDQRISEQKEKIRKTSALSQKALAHLETLKKYYDIDMAKRIITVSLSYDSVDDLIDENLSSKSRPVIKRDLLSKISSIAHTVPREFKIDVKLVVKDYKGYSHKLLTEALVDAFELFLYDVSKEKTYSNLKVAFLIIFGVIVLAWLFYISSKNWFGKAGDPDFDTMHEIIYTVGAVVLWEAIYIIFLPSRDYESISNDLVSHINNIFLTNKSNKILSKVSSKELELSIKVDNKSQSRARLLLLIAGTAILCLAGCKICDVVEAFIEQRDTTIAIVKASFLIVTVILGIFIGIGSISNYRDKGPFKNLIFIFAIISIFLCIGEIIFVGLMYSQYGRLASKTLVLTSLILALSIVYLVCICIIKNKKYIIEQPKGVIKP